MDDGKGDDPRRGRRRRRVHDYEELLAGRVAGRVPRRRREPRRVDVLHERHHRQPEGRRLLAPLDVPAHDGRDDDRRRSARASPTSSCRSCRCSTPTPGASRTPRSRAGASLVMPGPISRGKAIADLIVNERVTIAAGVPTIWMGVLPELKGRDTSSLRDDPVRRLGGAARRCRRPTASSSACRSCRRGA